MTDHSLSSSLLSKSTHCALISHLMATGKGGGGRSRSREEWGRGGEKMLLNIEEEGWNGLGWRREGQDGSQGENNSRGGWTDEQDKSKTEYLYQSTRAVISSCL